MIILLIRLIMIIRLNFFLKFSRNGVNRCGQGELAINSLMTKHLWSHLYYQIWQNKSTVDTACTWHIEHLLDSFPALHNLVYECCRQWVRGCDLVNRRLMIMERFICLSPYAKQCFIVWAILKYLSAVFGFKLLWRQTVYAEVSQVYSLWLVKYMLHFYIVKINYYSINYRSS